MRRVALGALRERDFRLLFASTTVDALGDGFALVALVFAVLEVSRSPAALGFVLAARQATQAAIVLAAGVWADRLPRHLVLVGSASVQATAQAATAALLLSGRASVAALVVLQSVYGLADGFVIPAQTGLIPDTVPEERLQDANALLGLSRNTVQVIGPALGGLAVAVGSPGAALAVDAGSFALAALLLVRLRPPGPAERQGGSFLAELREGWAEFSGRTWLWTTVTLFGIGNFAAMSWPVLGPVVAKRYLGGAPAWAALLSCSAAGSLAGGLIALRFRPRRPLAATVWLVYLILPQQVGVALHWPLPLLAALALCSGIGFALHLTLWFTVFQREVPRAALSRVSSYDTLGSFVLVPLGSVLAGTLAGVVGIRTTMLGAVVVQAVCLTSMLLLRSVWAIRGPEPEAALG